MTSPAVNVSKLHEGTLTLGVTPLDVSCQITNARILTAYKDEGNTLTVLCGDTVAAARKLDSRKVAGTLIQDFDVQEAAGGVIDYLFNHELEDVPFAFTPNQDGAPKLSGTITVEVTPESHGGDVGGQLTADFEWTITGPLTRTYGP